METDYLDMLGKNPVATIPKVPISIGLLSNEKGVLTPQYILWKDGTKYVIDEIIYIKPGGAGRVLYKVRVRGRAVNLYYYRNIWYVDKKG